MFDNSCRGIKTAARQISKTEKISLLKIPTKESPATKDSTCRPIRENKTIARAYRSRLLIDLFALARDKRLERGDKILRSGLLLRRRFSSDSRAISTGGKEGGGEDRGLARGGTREIERKPSTRRGRDVLVPSRRNEQARKRESEGEKKREKKGGILMGWGNRKQ